MKVGIGAATDMLALSNEQAIEHDHKELLALKLSTEGQSSLLENNWSLPFNC